PQIPPAPPLPPPPAVPRRSTAPSTSASAQKLRLPPWAFPPASALQTPAAPPPAAAPGVRISRLRDSNPRRLRSRAWWGRRPAHPVRYREHRTPEWKPAAPAPPPAP